ncbi:16227_t:CDS:2 [Dentiscutata heterogama]|uniref:16227_t:CDS:1 n=1 Tax=Dentiscutata heterogama TaxID=1316150 RepID=A0ACA9KWK5_9GLOM|nr:16227_t:CDS:2 [Dentiscutata heterogama]
MAFRRPQPPNQTTHRSATDKELELEQINQELREILQSEVAINKSNKKYIKDLERKYTRCENEIQSLNKELERLENASEKEKAELRSEISSLKKSLYQAKKEVRDKIFYIDSIEKQLQESKERVQNLRHRFKVISSRRSSPSLYNSKEEDVDMANLDLFIQIERGLTRIEKHLRGAGTPLNNPMNIINGIRGSLNTVQHNYQSAYQDIDGVIAQRDDSNNQIVQLQQDVNFYRQQNADLQNQTNQLIQARDTLQNHINRLTLERNNSQNNLALMTTAYNNERTECCRWREIAQQFERGMQMRINTLLLEKFTLNFKLRRCQRHGRELQQKYDMRGQEEQLLRPSQMEPGKKYRDPDLRLNDQEWIRIDEATDRLSALAGPSYLQTFMDTISKGVIDRITPLLPKKKKETSLITDDPKKKSDMIIDSEIRKIILAMFNDPEVIEMIKNNINNMNVSMTRRVAPEGLAKPDFINYREPAPP